MQPLTKPLILAEPKIGFGSEDIVDPYTKMFVAKADWLEPKDVTYENWPLDAKDFGSANFTVINVYSPYAKPSFGSANFNRFANGCVVQPLTLSSGIEPQVEPGRAIIALDPMKLCN
jgi:hypothetical protein